MIVLPQRLDNKNLEKNAEEKKSNLKLVRDGTPSKKGEKKGKEKMN